MRTSGGLQDLTMTSEHGDARPWEVWLHENDEIAVAAATQTVFFFFCAKFARNRATLTPLADLVGIR